MRSVHYYHFTSARIYTPIFAKHFNIRRYLGDRFIQIPIISSKATHHTITCCDRKNFTPVDFFQERSHFFWSSLSPAKLGSVIFSSGCSRIYSCVNQPKAIKYLVYPCSRSCQALQP